MKRVNVNTVIAGLFHPTEDWECLVECDVSPPDPEVGERDYSFDAFRAVINEGPRKGEEIDVGTWSKGDIYERAMDALEYERGKHEAMQTDKWEEEYQEARWERNG